MDSVQTKRFLNGETEIWSEEMVSTLHQLMTLIKLGDQAQGFIAPYALRDAVEQVFGEKDVEEVLNQFKDYFNEAIEEGA